MKLHRAPFRLITLSAFLKMFSLYRLVILISGKELYLVFNTVTNVDESHMNECNNAVRCEEIRDSVFNTFCRFFHQYLNENK